MGINFITGRYRVGKESSMRKILTLSLTLLVGLMPLSGWGAVPEDSVIFHIDFEDGKLPDQFKWTHAKITSDPEKVIDGEYSMIEAGPYPEMKPFPIDSVKQYRLEFDYYTRVTEEDKEMDFRVAADRGYWEGQTNPRLVRHRLEGPSGHASFTFRSIWPPETVFSLQFFHGTNTRIDNIKLTRLYNPDTKIAAPDLLIPFEGQQVSPVAANWFTWGFVEKYRDVIISQEIQWADNPQFEDAYSRIEPHLGAPPNWTPYIKLREKNTALAEFLSEPGKKYWRVRAINEYETPGKWSETASFTIQNEAGKVTPKRDLSSTPVYGQYVAGATTEELMEQWKTIPDAVKPYWVFQWSPHERNYDKIWLRGTESAFIDVLDFSEKHKIPLVLRMPNEATAVEWAYQNYDCVKGVEIKESRTKLQVDRGKDRIANNLKLAARYGKFVLDMEMNWPLSAFATIGTSEDLMSTIKEYSDYYIASDKKSAQFRTLRPVTTIMGFWLADLTGQWGMNVEDWYWYDRDGTGTANILPQKAILTTSGGGKALTTQSTTAYQSFDDVEKDYWRRKIWYPFLEELVKYHYTPSKEEVRLNIKIAAQLRPEDTHYEQFSFTTFQGIFQGIYGPIRHPYETIPNQNRYYLMPIFPQYGVDQSLLDSYEQVITSAEYPYPSQVQELFNQHYPEPGDYSGEAYIAHVEKSWFVLPTTEGEYRDGWNGRHIYGNFEKVQSPEDRTESYRLDLSHAGIQEITGRVNPYQYLMIRETDSGLRLHFGNRRDWESSLRLQCDREPKVHVHPGAALESAEWDASSGVFTVKTNHLHGAVSADVIVP